MTPATYAQILGTYSLAGPYAINGPLPRVGGVYVVLTPGRHDIVDCGETEDFSERIPNHDRRHCWFRYAGPNPEIWLHPMPGAAQLSRWLVEQDIRDRTHPPCGKR